MPYSPEDPLVDDTFGKVETSQSLFDGIAFHTIDVTHCIEAKILYSQDVNVITTETVK